MLKRQTILEFLETGLVATATISAFYGISLWLRADQKKMTVTLDYDTLIQTPTRYIAKVLPRLYGSVSPADRAAPSAKGTTEISRAAQRTDPASTTQGRTPFGSLRAGQAMQGAQATRAPEAERAFPASPQAEAQAHAALTPPTPPGGETTMFVPISPVTKEVQEDTAARSPDAIQAGTAQVLTPPLTKEVQEDAASRSRDAVQAGITQVPIPPVTKEVKKERDAVGDKRIIRLIQKWLQARIPVPGTGIVLARWGFGYSLEDAQKQALQTNVVHGRPLYLWMTFHGTQAAVDRMRADHRLLTEIHWARKSGSGPAAGTEQVMEFPIGRPGLASTFEKQISRRGYFERNIWQRRDALDPGMWTVSLTSSNGQVLLCDEDKRPCDITIKVQ